MRLTGDELREAVRHYQDSPELRRAITGRKNSVLHKVYTCESKELNTAADRVIEDAFTKQQPEQKFTGKSNDAPVKQVGKKLEESERKSEMSMGGFNGN